MASVRSLNIAIVTRHDDFHAHVVAELYAREARDVRCSLILSDSLAGSGRLSWSEGPAGDLARVRDAASLDVQVAELDVIWWRRLTGEAQQPADLNPEARGLVANDCRAALEGMLVTSFHGAWVSPPGATRIAQNKLVQLNAARAAGFAVPRTLVSQDPSEVRSFAKSLDFKVVVKAVSGSAETPVMTGRFDPSVVSDAAIELCPAIYQELVPGRRHLRVCCFGDDVLAVLLESDALDWRYPLNGTVHHYELGLDEEERIRRVVRTLGLRMGILDLKLGPDGELVWLEINPQGQFMFLEGMGSGIRLSRPFCEFLRAEALKSQQSAIASR
jgi:glutathione synthase/RimK-type ligase-like ATP-grasp enzyme